MICISVVYRPHITDQGSHCWCGPEEVEPGVMLHKCVDIMPGPANEPKMAVFSEQRPMR